MKKTEAQDASQRLMPGWVEPFLSNKHYYKNCPKHPNSKHKECNMFCLNCINDAFCCHCRTSLHSDHAVLQIRRSSYENAVRVMEVEKVLDVKGIQTYVINKSRVVYLNPREKRKPPINVNLSPKCVRCYRTLMDNSLFCSLKCKFEEVTKIGSPSPVDTCNDNGEKGSKGEGEGEGEGREKSVHHEYPHSNARKRKGVPLRSPLSGHLIGIL